MKAHHALPAAVAVAIAFSVPMNAEAQWSVEGRLGSTLPTGEMADDMNQTAGLSFAADLMYTTSPNFTIYGGVGQHRFNCDNCDADVTSTGLDGGVKLLVGSDGRAMPWVRGGLMLHKPEIDDVDGDWGLGLDSGVGIDWSLNHTFTLVPAVRFNTYSPNDTRLTYFTIDLGGHLHFGG
jgi:hypothetical protein